MLPRTISGRNVNEVLGDALWYLHISGEKADSRNGPVIRAPGPVISTYNHPMERLIFSETRDANHVFHLMETIWMFAGGEDVSWLLPFNSKFSQYAEDNGEQWGAYGHRWRHHFGFNQLAVATRELTKSDNRRVVIGMWSPEWDLGANVRDVPCNTHIYLQVRRGRLEMTVCCRSNDVIWGAYGANAVHFSMLQELIARELDVGMGPYHQFSNDFHLYTEMGPGAKMLSQLGTPMPDPYRLGCSTVPLLQGSETMDIFLEDCERFVDDEDKFATTFMRMVAYPLKVAYLSRKETGRWDTSMIPECDWRVAFDQWAARRTANVSE